MVSARMKGNRQGKGWKEVRKKEGELVVCRTSWDQPRASVGSRDRVVVVCAQHRHLHRFQCAAAHLRIILSLSHAHSGYIHP